MKQLIKTILIVLIISAAGYFIYSSVVIINEGNIGIAEDTGDKVVVQILQPGVNVIWRSIIPGRVDVLRLPVKGSSFFDVTIDIPPLGSLDSKYYSINVPIDFNYRLQPDSLSFDPGELKEGKQFIKNTVEKVTTGEINKEFSRYLSPSYNRIMLLRQQENLVASAFKNIKKKCDSLGIEITELNVSGNISFPDNATYYEGVRYYNELRQMERNNRKELILLKNDLKKKELSRDKYIDKLKRISTIVKDNPDLLKFIYIDKLGGNVKVILSSEKTGVPFGLSLEEIKDEKKTTGDIDNLR
ncbi:MAG: SPFH domain-containing protein [bacterium]